MGAEAGGKVCGQSDTFCVYKVAELRKLGNTGNKFAEPILHFQDSTNEMYILLRI